MKRPHASLNSIFFWQLIYKENPFIAENIADIYQALQT